MGNNVKKRTAHNILFGKDSVTGNIRHISEVVSGEKCGCVCCACDKPLEARKGSVRKHHFAHVSNYECLYASEVSIYKAVAGILFDLHRFYIPPVILSFPARKNGDLLKPGRYVTIENVEFSCEPLQYPPYLFLTVSGSKLRILLEFDYYYSQEDLQNFEKESRNENYSSLLCYLPNIEDEIFFSTDNLRKFIASKEMGHKWIRSELIDKWKRRFTEKAYDVENPDWECPIHVRKYLGRYTALWTDCVYCPFNVGDQEHFLCIAKSGIQSHEDFFKDPKILQNEIAKIRERNDWSIKKEAEQRKRNRQRYVEQQQQILVKFQSRSTALVRPAIAVQQIPELKIRRPETACAGELLAEENRMKKIFDPCAELPTYDKFARRWVQCERCGEIKLSSEFAEYGGSGKSNLGLCSICYRL